LDKTNLIVSFFSRNPNEDALECVFESIGKFSMHFLKVLKYTMHPFFKNLFLLFVAPSIA
jgi:Serpin (serine protease inhibitor)